MHPIHEHETARPRHWHARWIWVEGDGRAQNTYVTFRRVFEAVGTVRLFISADTRYHLFLDGKSLGRGPVMSQPYHQFYDAYAIDLGPSTAPHCIAVVVQHLGTVPGTRGGLLCELTDEAGGQVLATDARWRCQVSPAWRRDTHAYTGNRGCPFQEFFDANLLPDGWTLAATELDWPFATVVVDGESDKPPTVRPWTKLLPREIPHMEIRSHAPASIVSVEEHQDLANRSRPRDLSPLLSQAGVPLRHARVVDPGNLLHSEGATLLASSREHLADPAFDGIHAPSVLLDFGRIVTARIRLDVECVGGGGHVLLGYVERLVDGHFNNAMECEFADRLTLRPGRQTFETFAWKSFRYVRLRLHAAPHDVLIHQITAEETRYPFHEAGYFESTDETLDGVFRLCRQSLRLCCHEAIVDTPWREQAQWLGDVARVSVPSLQSCFGDVRLATQFFRQSAQNQHPTGFLANISNTVSDMGWDQCIPDFSLWWVQALWEHWLYSGDAEGLHRLYPQALRILQAHLDYLRGGLVRDMPYWVFLDWARLDRRGASAVYNAIFYKTLGVWARLAQWVGDSRTDHLVSALQTGVEQSFHAEFFAEDGLYADARSEGELSPLRSEQANFAAIWAGLCPRHLREGIVDRIWGPKAPPNRVEAQPFFCSVVLDALAEMDRMDLALDLIRERWGRRMLARGATGTYEEWWSNGSRRNGVFEGFLRSSSHAWSASPADFLLRRLAGIRIVEPGGRRVSVCPHVTPFDVWVSFPLLHGSVRYACVGGEIQVSTEGDVERCDPPD